MIALVKMQIFTSKLRKQRVLKQVEGFKAKRLITKALSVLETFPAACVPVIVSLIKVIQYFSQHMNSTVFTCIFQLCIYYAYLLRTNRLPHASLTLINRNHILKFCQFARNFIVKWLESTNENIRHVLQIVLQITLHGSGKLCFRKLHFRQLCFRRLCFSQLRYCQLCFSQLYLKGSCGQETFR